MKEQQGEMDRVQCDHPGCEKWAYMRPWGKYTHNTGEVDENGKPLYHTVGKVTATVMLPPEALKGVENRFQNDERRSYRIERQHSQNMALLFLQLLPVTKVSDEKELLHKVAELTDHFHADLEMREEDIEF